MGIAPGRPSRLNKPPAYKSSPKCQSCGIKLVHDEQGGGTNADGSRSTVFCSHCFEGGRFIDPDITLEKMRSQVWTRLVKLGYPKFATRFMTLGIGSLDRWKKKVMTEAYGG